MKFTVEVEEFWLEEEELTEALQAHIKSTVIRKYLRALKIRCRKKSLKK